MSQRTPTRYPRFLTPLSVLFLVALTTALYLPGLRGPFILDDVANISPLSFDTGDFRPVLEKTAQNTSGPLGRPVSTFSLALTSYLSGLEPEPFKRTNLAIHLIVGLLLLWLGILLARTREEDSLPWVFAGAVLLWMIHPLHVSTTLYAVQRMAQLGALFSVLAMVAYTKFRLTLREGRTVAALPALAAYGAAAIIALLSKETGALIPLFVLLIEIIFFRFETGSNRRAERIGLRLLVLIPVVAGALLFLFSLPSLESGYEQRDFTLFERAITQPAVLLFYLRLLLLPVTSQMGLYHDDFPIHTGLGLSTVIPVAIIATLLFVALLGLRKRSLAAFGLMWFFAGHALESTIFPLEMVFEHRNYLPSFGIFITVTTGIAYLHRKSEASRKVTLTLCALFVTLLALQTLSRSQTWGSQKLLFAVNVIHHPDSVRAISDMANLLLSQNQRQEARKLLHRAIDLSPSDTGPILHLIMSYCPETQVPGPLLARLQKTLPTTKITPYTISALDNIQRRFMQNNCSGLRREELRKILHTAVDNAKSADAPDDLMYTTLILAREEAFEGHKEAAINNYQIAQSLTTRNLRPLLEMTDYLLATGDFEGARSALSVAKKFSASLPTPPISEIEALESLLSAHGRTDRAE